MSEGDEFSGFRLQPGRAGTKVAVFRLRVPEFRMEALPDGTPRAVETHELRFDEASLVARIETLRGQGLDASLSEEALRALRLEGGSAAPRPGQRLPTPEEVARALGPVAQITADAVLVVARPPGAAEAQILHVNPAFARLTGHGAAGLHGAPLSRVLAPGQGAGGGSFLRRRDGVPLPFDLREAPLVVEAAGPFPCTVLAGRPAGSRIQPGGPDDERDELTGLRGEAALLRAIADDLVVPGAWQRRPPCIALLRIQALGAIAARFGHRVGNAVLLGVADRLVANLRQGDLACRVGEGEFAVYLGSIGLSQTGASLARLHGCVTASPLPTPKGALPIRLALGLTAVEWREGEGDVMAALQATLAAARRALPVESGAEVPALLPLGPG